MAGKLRFVILGCGSSPGVPRANGDWGACDPNEPKNRRLRASAFVQRIAEDGGTTNVVIDTGPDFREQILSTGVRRLDAAVYTHAHADHLHGIDDLRTFVLTQRARMDCWMDDATFERAVSGFRYAFEQPPGSDYPPILRRRSIELGRPFEIDGAGGALQFLPLRQHHGRIDTLAFRIGPIAYCTDVSEWPDETPQHLMDAELLVIDALQYRRHPSHYSLEQALDWIERLRPKRAVLTHMHIPLDYQTVLSQTPAHVEPGYDGMEFEFDLS